MGTKTLRTCGMMLVALLTSTLPVMAAGHAGITDCFVCHDFVNSTYDCSFCHDFSENAFEIDDHYNVRWVAQRIEYPPGTVHEPVRATALSWNTSWGDTPDGTLADGDDSKLDGPCEVCHTKTAFHTNSGDGTSHYDGQKCITCHPHFPDGKDYFSAQLKGPESHKTHLVADKGPKISECTECHDAQDFTVFADGNPLATTGVCDACHSPEGHYDGINDRALGAKANWDAGVYQADGSKLRLGKEGWCATCHDEGTSVIGGVLAPNVMGDSATYGYNMTGHGYFHVPCEGCHDLTASHTDGTARTYSAVLNNYSKGYRLNEAMAVPRNREMFPEAFKLCTGCHDYSKITGAESNFRDDNKHFQYHLMHLEYFPGILVANSDFDINDKADSAMTCISCHNVHGAPTGPMVRHGELISSIGTSDKVPALDFKWYGQDGATPTTFLEDSAYGALVCGIQPYVSLNHVCAGCHASGEIKWYRTPVVPARVRLDAIWASDTGDVVKQTFSPGETIRYHARFTVRGPDTYVGRIAESAAGNVSWMVGTDWLTPLSKEGRVSSGTFDVAWDEVIPSEASPGSPAKLLIRVGIFDSAAGTLLYQDRQLGDFSIQVNP